MKPRIGALLIEEINSNPLFFQEYDFFTDCIKAGQQVKFPTPRNVFLELGNIFLCAKDLGKYLEDQCKKNIWQGQFCRKDHGSFRYTEKKLLSPSYATYQPHKHPSATKPSRIYCLGRDLLLLDAWLLSSSAVQQPQTIGLCCKIGLRLFFGYWVVFLRLWGKCLTGMAVFLMGSFLAARCEGGS